jgi:hypothetical protein
VPRFHICSVTNLPGFDDLPAKFGMLWRFLPMADPWVDVMVSRDLDSRSVFLLLLYKPSVNPKDTGGVTGTTLSLKSGRFSWVKRRKSAVGKISQ